jgi:CheY-like chemotaxis protein
LKKEQPLTQLLFVTPDRTPFADLSAGIERQGGSISWATSGRQALETIGKAAVDLVLADETLGDMTGLEFIKRLVALNPLINCAVVSSLPNDAYHEASEGLGILMQLPPNAGRAEGDRLMARLNQILGLTATTNI